MDWADNETDFAWLLPLVSPIIFLVAEDLLSPSVHVVLFMFSERFETPQLAFQFEQLASAYHWTRLP